MTIHEAAARGFERQAEAYERGRPGYPPDAIAWLIDQLGLRPDRTVVDVGAGTGKLARALEPSGAEVIAVEPVEGMRAVLARELPAVRALSGTAESTALDPDVADAVVVGQAFHWFDAPAALAEFRRVLRPAGRLGLVWNVRDRRQELQRAIDEITEPLRGDTPSQAGGGWREQLERSELFRPVAQLERPFSLVLDPDTAVDRIGSVSFVAALEDPRRVDVLDRVRALVREHPEPWSYVTEVYVFEATP